VTRRPASDRRTKIVATIGPASDDPSTLAAMARVGMDVARVPLAHGTTDDALARIERIRASVPHVGILADLPGPKIRSAPFPAAGVTLETGTVLELFTATNHDQCSSYRIGVNDPDLVQQLSPGDRVAIGDGGIALEVVAKGDDGRVTAEVQSGGAVKGRPGITVVGDRLALRSPTTEDLARMAALAETDVDAVAASFVRSRRDIEALREVAGANPPMIVAKIETSEATQDLDAIVDVADGVMVARGDLGVRLPMEDVPHIQKQIIRTAVRYGRPVITATQMLESMVTASTPTRAEVTDVANAVLDGTSAVMLSGETAIGTDPVGVVATMARITTRAEREFDYLAWGSRLGVQTVADGATSSAGITAAISAAGWRAAVDESADVIIACTLTGRTARFMSRFRLNIPLVATTPSPRTARQLTLSWGVETILVPLASSLDVIVDRAVRAAAEAGYVEAGDIAVVLAGSPGSAEPTTDTLRLVLVD
jgi:pyruvate kinase